MNLVLVKSHHEEELLLKLVQEHASRVILPRNFKPSDTFKKFAANKVYGILEVTLDESKNEAVYEIALPSHYTNFFEYMINKHRV